MKMPLESDKLERLRQIHERNKNMKEQQLKLHEAIASQ